MILKRTYDALLTLFSNAIVMVCLFHLGQSLWCLIQNEGYLNLFLDEENIKLYLCMLIVFTFVLSEDVGFAFDELSESRPNNLQNDYDYWEDKYVVLLRRNRRANPFYPTTMWNM